MSRATKKPKAKAGRGKSVKRAPARKKAAVKKSSAPRRRPVAAKKKPAGKPSRADAMKALARKIVRMSQASSFGDAEIQALYLPDAVSVEASGDTAVGHAGLREKMAGWSQMTASMVAKPRHVWVGNDSICIEWDNTVTMHDGRTVKMNETAIHEIRNGKIARERYYYNPMSLMPPAESAPGQPLTGAAPTG